MVSGRFNTKYFAGNIAIKRKLNIIQTLSVVYFT